MKKLNENGKIAIGGAVVSGVGWTAYGLGLSSVTKAVAAGMAAPAAGVVATVGGLIVGGSGLGVFLYGFVSGLKEGFRDEVRVIEEKK